MIKLFTSNISMTFLKKNGIPIKKIKSSFIIFLLFFLISGCSTINKNDADNTNNTVNTSNVHNFLTDIFSKLQSKTEIENETDSVLKSTQELLQSTPELTQAKVQEQIDDQLKNTQQAVQFDDVWTRLPTLFQLSEIQNSRINSQEKLFIRHKKHIEKISKRATPFLYFITEEVNKRHMPGEIALLPIIESSFKPKAYSRMKAAGLWQFVPATGRYFGLKQNWWYDGRRDVYQSTIAALTYLEQLNKYYKGDWLLALAAYNAGAGNVNKAIRKNIKKGKPIDYWSLDLPRETFKYVPKLLAISRIIQKHNEYNISLAPIENKPYLMLVDTQSQINLSVAAKIADISLAEIHAYNPAFKQWATDPDGPHHLLIPIDKAAQFKTQIASLDEKDRVQWYRHKIRSGESLSVIARKYRISVALLKQANHLKNSRIRAGKYLMVPQDTKPENLASMKLYRNPKKTKSTTKTNNSQIYTVRKGDSFWKIAHHYQISHKKLALLNGLSVGDTLSIGQSLIISQKTSKNILQSSISPDGKKTRKIIYKVKSGDSLYTISKQFKVTINDLKLWNSLNIKKYLKPGQQLSVFVVESQSS